MRIPFPERVPINRVAIFAIVLFIVQQVEHTALYFSIGCTLFILIAAFAFNTAGGLTRASGAYVFFYSMLVVIVGICYKAFLGEPAQSNLSDPVTDIEVYVGGITAMLGAVIVNHRFARKTGLLQNVLKESQMYRSSVGCIVFGILGPFIIGLLGETGIAVQTAFGQLNQLVALGIIIGVMHEIRRSGGTRSITVPVIVATAFSFIIGGFIGYSKQGMLLPLVCWFAPVCALRFRLSALKVLGVVLGVFVLFYYLVPYAQYGRRFSGEGKTFSEKLMISVGLLENLEDVRKKYLAEQAETPAGALGEYFNTPQGFWDRLVFVGVDDPLINVTDQGKVLGLGPIAESFINAVPHFIWPNKPHPRLGGNYYAHEIGVISDEDVTTGISFSPTAEAYHMMKWVGVFVVAPLLWFLLFFVFDSIFGDLRSTPWGLLAMALISHEAPEGALSGLIYLLTFGTEILVFCALFAAWVAPFFAIPVLGPDRKNTGPRFSFRNTTPPPEATDEPA